MDTAMVSTTRTTMPRELRFVHNGEQFQAILVDEVPLSPEPCWLCRKPLYGRAFYVTSPPLFDVHADCARECSFFENLPRTGDRSPGPATYNGYPYSGADAYYQSNYTPSHVDGQQRSTGGPALGQRIALAVMGAFLQALFSAMMGDFGFGAF